MLNKSVLQEWQGRVSSKKCLTRVSSKSVSEECQTRVSNQSVMQECLTSSAIVSGKGVRQECHLSVSSQCVPQVGSLEIVTNKYYIFVSQHTCRHSGSWASSCFEVNLLIDMFVLFWCLSLLCKHSVVLRCYLELDGRRDHRKEFLAVKSPKSVGSRDLVFYE